MKRTVVAIDPGTNLLGWAVLSIDNEGYIELEDCSYHQFDGRETLLSKLNILFSISINLVCDHQPQFLMLEKTFKVDRGSLALVVGIKIIKESVELTETKVIQENAMRVRKHFGVGARDSITAKANVKKFILDTFELDDDLPQDVYDAVLLGYYAIDHEM